MLLGAFLLGADRNTAAFYKQNFYRKSYYYYELFLVVGDDFLTQTIFSYIYLILSERDIRRAYPKKKVITKKKITNCEELSPTPFL